MPTILLAEDESAIAQAVLFALRAEGWQAEHVMLGNEVLPRLRRGGVDLVILDVGLPDISGFEVCRALRVENPLPVIFLTARDGEVDRVLGLELGADDYVPKPFSPRELVARVRARLRRVAPVPAGGWRAHGRFGIDESGHRIRFDGWVLDLTRYEYGLLAALLSRPGAVLTRAQLMDRVWEDAPDSGERTVDTHVKTVRAKLREIAPESDPIRTHRGIGYALDTDGRGAHG
ncbi:two-component system response regulator CreB [Lysobacter pythonis]|uniref:Two-component system response regulator CreB n=1 Tax=Solilutibacter pythonis TaxID=2483112 RepID=A0A3M2HZM9_9GAMM|nr:two-component system response regulator CreB [Lysobacter pythonis]RMH94458.1 two-component system response regulator CreB [Lysobacter pythonis]